jgi:hypothetical protein
MQVSRHVQSPRGRRRSARAPSNTPLALVQLGISRCKRREKGFWAAGMKVDGGWAVSLDLKPRVEVEVEVEVGMAREELGGMEGGSWGRPRPGGRPRR